MKVLRIFEKILTKAFLPIKANAMFFVSMYVLGVVCEWLTVPHNKGAQLYDNLYLELFLDLYVACVVLFCIPEKVRKWVKRVLYVVLYVVAVVDVYCFWKFDSTLTPTMLLLVGETDSREAGEFLKQYLSPDVLLSPVSWVFVVLILHALAAWKSRFLKAKIDPVIPTIEPYLGIFVGGLFVWSCFSSFSNKVATAKIYSSNNIGDVEHTLTEPDRATFYTPIYRLIFSLYANSLAARQINNLVEEIDKVKVDSCSYRSPNIVLIIGESYGKQHDEQYGYFMPTAPRQIAREKSGLLVKYTDVVSPWNLTSFVFKNVFSMHVIGQKGEWCDYPLFTELFRKAGYHVTFLTNQFLPQAKEAVYDFSGGFFLNNPKLSAAQFDTRNSELHPYDDGLLSDYDKLKNSSAKYNLTIFHLIGQHVNYKTRYPHDRTKFYAGDYDESRPELSPKQKKLLSHYDNACLYNDSIVDEICKRFENKDAIVIYMPDHGEECYEGTRGIVCRNHSAAIDYGLAKYEFEIPFWIYCSHTYAVKHPDLYKAIVQARHRRFMTDALPHLLVYLAGISAPSYHAEYNILSPQYNENRPRLLKATTDYDKLRKGHENE
jgi:heptose-I-phosphate ethanolaminephosphotransferase